jgi:hypothetical protein
MGVAPSFFSRSESFWHKFRHQNDLRRRRDSRCRTSEVSFEPRNDAFATT